MPTRKRSKSAKVKPDRQRPYVMPKTAAELGITCAICGGQAEYFDPDRHTESDSRKAFICADEPRSAGSQRLLIRAGQGITGRCELAEVSQ
jgi:hypothetical protein